MNISGIVNEEKCLSCGLCKSICPVGAIELKYMEKKGVYQPTIINKKCIECSKCISNCIANNNVLHKNLIGTVLQGYLAHATDIHVRTNATSGGVINRLVYYLLDSGEVEVVVMVVRDELSPIEASSKIFTRENLYELDNVPREFASRYVVVPVLEKIQDVLKKYNKIAVVGTPCQIRGLDKFTYLDKTIIKIGITCSGGMSYLATEEYKQKMKCKDSKMYYRGKGWPGENSLIANSLQIDNAHQGSLFERMFSSQVFKIKGCRLCQDHFAEEADISFCDYWNADEMKVEHIGNSCVIIRNKLAHRIFNNMLLKGYVEIVKELTMKEIINSQLTVLKVKKGTVKETKEYKIFMWLIDFIRKNKLYKGFNFKVYRKLAEIYFRISQKGIIEYKEK